MIWTWNCWRKQTHYSWRRWKCEEEEEVDYAKESKESERFQEKARLLVREEEERKEKTGRRWEKRKRWRKW